MTILLNKMPIWLGLPFGLFATWQPWNQHLSIQRGWLLQKFSNFLKRKYYHYKNKCWRSIFLSTTVVAIIAVSYEYLRNESEKMQWKGKSNLRNLIRSFYKSFYLLFLSVCPIWLPIFFLIFPWMNQNWVQESILAWLLTHFHLVFLIRQDEIRTHNL